jgi:translocation and assembly module TamB
VGGAESLVKLTWQLSRNLSLIARGGSDNAFDLYYTFSFR